MCMKSILAPVDGAASSQSVLDAAFCLARNFNAHIKVLHVAADPKAAIPLLGEGMSGGMIEDMISMAEKESNTRRQRAHSLYLAALTKFDANEVSGPGEMDGLTASWHQTEGREDEVITHFGRLCDLILVPKPTEDNQIYTTLALNAALFETGRPMLLLPEKSVEKMGTSIAVCWNGSAEGARAVAASMALIKNADQVHVITADSSATDTPVGNELVEYLAWHGVVAKAVFFSPAGKTVGRSLLMETKKLGCDMMVMGGYSHSRVRELILGGVTRDIIELANIPVIMGH